MGAFCSSAKRKLSCVKKRSLPASPRPSLDSGSTPFVTTTNPLDLNSTNMSRSETLPIQHPLRAVLIHKGTRKRPYLNRTQQPASIYNQTNSDNDLLKESSTFEKYKNLENFTVIWLDEHIVDDQLIAAVRAEVNSLQIFYDVERCLRQIFTIVTEKIFVIVTGAFYENIAFLLEFYESVESIYIFCPKQDKYELYKEEHSIWSEYKKILGVFNNIDDICAKIRQISIRCAHQIPTTTSISHRYLAVARRSLGLNKLEASFMYSQLIKDILVSMTHGDAKSDLINLFRTYYHGNDNRMRWIDEFQINYSRDNAILWYTKEPFFYGTLNKALRTQDIDTLHKMRYFITDIHQQIEELSAQPSERSIFKVYRGQCMSRTEFQTHSLNSEGLISFNNLLSCSKDIAVAQAYVDSQEQDQDTVLVLFQITIDPNIRITSFADITTKSFYGDTEMEFLFSMGTIFRIRSIQPWHRDNRIELFDLLLTSDEDEDLKNLREHMRQEIGGTSNLINFGRLLIEMGDLNNSEQFYKIVLRETSVKDDPRTVAMIYNDLGCIASQRHYKMDALKLYEMALSIGHERFPRQDAQLSPILNNIGEIYLELKQFDKAKEYFEDALNIDLSIIPANAYTQAIRYHNIGMVYKERDDFFKALKNFNKSLELKQSTLPPTHPSIAISSRSIGDIYRAQRNFPAALELCNRALAIETSSLPPHHLSLSMTHRCIALIHRGQGNFGDALYEMTAARDIARETLPATHPSIIDMEKEIAGINGEILRMLRR